MKIGIIGVGAMGSALAKGLAKSNVDLVLQNPNNPRVSKLADQIHATLVHDTKGLASTKPNMVMLVTPAPITLEIAKTLTALPDTVPVISSAAGVKLADLKNVLPWHPLARIIPNTPVAVNDGAIGLTFGDNVKENDQKAIQDLLSKLGAVMPVSEDKLDIVGVIGGCGPAYVDVFMDALSDAAVAHGLDRQTAYQLAAAMIKGSGALALQSGQAPALLRDEVTSPAGTTIKGVLALEKDGFRHAVIDAVNHSANDED